MKINVQNKGDNSCINCYKTMLEVKMFTVPLGKCQERDCLLSHCPEGCACSTVTRATGEIITFYAAIHFEFYFCLQCVTTGLLKALPRSLSKCKVINFLVLFSEALIQPQFECFRQYADLKEKTSESQGHSICIGSFFQQEITQT